MLALGVLGLTNYRRSKVMSEHERAWKDAMRKQCRISATCEVISLDEVQDADRDQPQSPSTDIHLSMELLNGSAEYIGGLLEYEIVRLTWANRSALKGRIVALNVESPYLDNLLRRAACEEVGGFAFCSKQEQPLSTAQIQALMQRVKDVFKGMPSVSIPPVLLVFGDASSLMSADSSFCLRITDINELVLPKEQLFLLPGGCEGHYESSWVPEVVTDSFSKNDTLGTLNSIENFWSWLSDANVEEYETKQDLATRMKNMELYQETRYLT